MNCLRTSTPKTERGSCGAEVPPPLIRDLPNSKKQIWARGTIILSAISSRFTPTRRRLLSRATHREMAWSGKRKGPSQAGGLKSMMMTRRTIQSTSRTQRLALATTTIPKQRAPLRHSRRSTSSKYSVQRAKDSLILFSLWRNILGLAITTNTTLWSRKPSTRKLRPSLSISRSLDSPKASYRRILTQDLATMKTSRLYFFVFDNFS